MFSPDIIGERVATMLERYDFIDEDMLVYFNTRLTQVPRDANFALSYVKEHARTEEQRIAVCNALVFKTDILWTLLDALYFAYVEPALPPPDAFRPEWLEAAK